MFTYQTAAAAQTAFYAAFMDCDIEAMQHLWADENVVCVHPGSDVIQGKAAVMQSWRRILSPGPNATIHVESLGVTETAEIAVFVVYEHLVPDPSQPPVTVVATNIFQLGSQGWQMIEHHGSPPIAGLSADSFAMPEKRVLQ